MKIAVYNRFLTTLGGGERYMLKIAEILGRFAKVDILSQELVPRDVIQSRMGIDIGDVNMELLKEPSGEAVEATSEKYDVFINASHLDPISSRAPISILLVHFPSPTATRIRGLVNRGVDRLVCPVLWAPVLESGFSHQEGSPDAPFWWTDGDGHLRIPARPGSAPRLLVPLASLRMADERPTVRFVSGDDELAVVRVPSGSDFHGFSVVPTQWENGSYLLSIQSDTFRPPAEFNDPRQLGVAVGPIRATGWRGVVTQKALERLRPGFDQHLCTRRQSRTPSYVHSYDAIWTVSNFVEYWTRRYWNVSSLLINPPVDVEGIKTTGVVPKENLILNVGRFFEGHHNKKHLEMVEAFRSLVERGLQGWRLVLVGGAPDEPSHRDYLGRVQQAAEDLPIRIANDIPYSELLDLYARASIYWHATGLGEDEHRDPAAMEHFGITTVEAMAAGCVPVVIRKAGQAEIVRHRECGLLWKDLDGLKSCTWEVIADATLRRRLSEAARRRSQDFSNASFERRMLELVNRLLPAGERFQAGLRVQG